MNEPLTTAPTDPAKRFELRRRAKLGVVASYIHELSERHNGTRLSRPPRASSAHPGGR